MTSVPFLHRSQLHSVPTAATAFIPLDLLPQSNPNLILKPPFPFPWSIPTTQPYLIYFYFNQRQYPTKPLPCFPDVFKSGFINIRLYSRVWRL